VPRVSCWPTSTVNDHVFIAAERVCELWMLRLDQQPQLVLVRRIEQLQV
jgi:hypothetical protein